ncbi:MAG: TetR/AcrR family transcriptional regulator [Desulfomonile tiedjei]|nr:TetR/AcrR family transcriptional regulator [Desulfomonile tiedjei]
MNRPNTQLRRKKEAEARRTSILEAARKSFLLKGIAGTTMNDIARMCNLAKGTLYLYFASKEEVAFALLLRATENLLAALQDALEPRMRAIDQLHNLALAYYRFFEAQPESFRFMFVIPHESYTGKISQDLIDRWGNTGQAALTIVDRLLRQAASEGDIEVDDTRSTATALWSAITGVIVIPSQEVRLPFLGEINVERMVRTTVDLFLAGMRPTRGSGDDIR